MLQRGRIWRKPLSFEGPGLVSTWPGPMVNHNCDFTYFWEHAAGEREKEREGERQNELTE